MKKVAILMGSDSDLAVMKDSALALEELKVSYEMFILSAHRTPDKAAAFAGGAEKEGFGVIIAGAGGAAHLPGVVAAYTALPVIGVPVDAGSLGGMDALYAIIQMPRGIPVATVAVNGAFNAGLLAAQILATADVKLRERFRGYKERLAKGVEAKNHNLHKKGWRRYLEEKAR